MKARIIFTAALFIGMAGCTAAEWCSDGDLYFTGNERNSARVGCAVSSSGSCGVYTYYVHEWELMCIRGDGSRETDWWTEKPTDARPPDAAS